MLDFQGLYRSLRNMVLHYPDVYKHPGKVALSAISEGPIKTQSAVLSDQLVSRQAQKATEADFENSSKLGEYGTLHAWVPGRGAAMQWPLAH